MKNLFLLPLIGLALVGCVSTPSSLYSWGSYPEQSYLMYSQPQKASPSAQIQKLEAEVEKSKAKNLAVPPGLYAHLGLMYAEENNMNRAAEYFQLERQVYPESTVLMDRLLKQLTGNKGAAK
ncbi:DUF4810 domain-containing protein [Acinetobacter rudis]|uniref:DUF4810 domain-containing protein n=1 Tax=Acinetobacter rudis TaxID=632955 RepID=UPI003340492B